MSLTPYASVIGLTEEEKKKKQAVRRVAQQEGKCRFEITKLRTRLLAMEVEISEMAARPELDIVGLSDKKDEIAFQTRQIAQMEQIVSELFPAESA